MDYERLFSLANTMVLPGWLLLVFLPRWRYSAGFVASCLLPALLGLAYLAIFLTHFGSQEQGFSAFSSLAGVKSLFQSDALLLAGWIHYLAFDLFVGSWEVRDSRRLGINHLWVAPCLVLTFLLGPVGLLLYFALRLTMRRRWTVEELPADAQPAH
jgi:hypothetical protein